MQAGHQPTAVAGTVALIALFASFTLLFVYAQRLTDWEEAVTWNPLYIFNYFSFCVKKMFIKLFLFHNQLNINCH